MKSFLIILFIVINFVSYSYNLTESDSVEIYIFPDTIQSNNNYNNINCLVINLSSDTLLLINEFFLTGVVENSIGWPMASYYYPNFIFFDPTKKHRFVLDGRYKINYNDMPSMIGILPASSVNISVNILFLREKLKGFDWNMYASFKLAKKHQLDLLVIKRSPETFADYLKKITFEKTIDATIKTVLPFDDTPDEGIFNFIQEVFNIMLLQN